MWLVAGCGASGGGAVGGGDQTGSRRICPDHPEQCGGTCCGGACIDTQSDSNNCGDCGVTCSTGQLCAGGHCGCLGSTGASVVCGSGQSCCPDTGCKSLDSDANNCGSCGHACGAGATCSGGVCACGGQTCSSGQVCCNGQCASSCSVDMSAPPDMTTGTPPLCQCSDGCVFGLFGACVGTDCCELDVAEGYCQAENCTPN